MPVIGITFVAFLAVLAASVVYVNTRRRNDSWTWLEESYERYASSHAITDDVAVPPTDPDATWRELERQNPAACAVARSSQFALPAPAGKTLHEFGDVLVERMLEVLPDWAYELGLPPPSEEITVEDDVTRARWHLLCADAWKAVNLWRQRSDLTPHDRADADALLGWLGRMLGDTSNRDGGLVWWIRSAFDILPRLELNDAMPVSVRARHAESRLRAIAPRLTSAVDALRRPPRAAILDAAAALEAAERHLANYASTWAGLSDAERASLDAAAAEARDAASRGAARLRQFVVSGDPGGPGMGPVALASSMRSFHRLELTPREAYDRALEQLRSAHDDLRAAWIAGKGDESVDPYGPDDECLSRLCSALPHWAADVPPDEQPTIRPAPRLWAHEAAAAWYVDPGRLGPAGRAVILVSRPADAVTGSETRASHMTQRHLFAHEGYPGHRLQALFDRSSCVVRRLVDDRVSREGWATYAQDLIHETGDCTAGPRDDYARAAERRGVAIRALNAILVATGAADDDAVLRLMRDSGYADPTLADVGSIAAWGDYPLGYLLGSDEIRALRREEEERLGAAFDLRAFHTRLLKEGPIPVPLIRRQWREEREK